MQKTCRLWEIIKGIEGMNGVKVTLHIKIKILLKWAQDYVSLV